MRESYIGFKPCGCIAVYISADPKYKKFTASEVAKAIREGYRLELKSHEWLLSEEGKAAQKKCDHGTIKAQLTAQAALRKADGV